MTGALFLAYVQKILKRPDKDADAYECMTDTIMDMRLRMYSEKFQFEAYTSSIGTLGDYKLALPSDFGHLIGNITGVEDNNQAWPITKISKDSYDEMYGDRLFSTVSNRNLARPKNFCVFGEQLFLGPVPDRTTYIYQLNYTTENAEDVIAGTVLVPFTDKYREIVRHGVLQRMFEILENPLADYHEKKYEMGIQKIIANDGENTLSVEPIRYSGF